MNSICILKYIFSQLLHLFFYCFLTWKRYSSSATIIQYSFKKFDIDDDIKLIIQSWDGNFNRYSQTSWLKCARYSFFNSLFVKAWVFKKFMDSYDLWFVIYGDISLYFLFIFHFWHLITKFNFDKDVGRTTSWKLCFFVIKRSYLLLC